MAARVRRRPGDPGLSARWWRSLRERRRRFERALERRWPKLYDARHAATGVGQALWPFVGPLLAALILLPIVALLAALVAVLDIDLPPIDLPAIPLPDVSAPGWLRAIGDAVGAVFAAVASVAHYVVIACAVALGLHRTRAARRRRIAAEQVGRDELLRRLATALRAAEARALHVGATSVGDAAAGRDE